MSRVSAWNRYYLLRQVIVVQCKEVQYLVQQARGYKAKGYLTKAAVCLEQAKVLQNATEPFIARMEEALKEATKPTKWERLKKWLGENK